MAANVETMFYTREKPWHGLGTMVKDSPSSVQALSLAGLDWKVEQHPIVTTAGIPLEGFWANVRNTDNKVLGVVSDKYKVVQNEEAFAFTDTLLGEGVTYETAGSLQEGRKVWLLAKLPQRYIISGDEITPYLVFSNSHDGSGAIKVAMTPIRVVCNNTLNLALEKARRTWSTTHTGNLERKNKRNAKGAGSFKKNPDGTITHRKSVGYKSDGNRKILTVTADTKSACIKEMRKKELAWEKEKKSTVFTERVIVEELCKMHLQYQIDQGELKPKSIDRRECTIEKHIGKFALGKMQVQAVKSSDIDTHINGLINAGKLSYSSIEKVLDVLNAAYNWALLLGKLEHNPVSQIKASLYKRINKIKYKSSDEADVVVLTDEEVKMFRAEALSVNTKTGKYQYPAGVYGLLLLYTGMRCGEMIALRWKDVDFENGLLKIEKSQSMAKNRTGENEDKKYIAVEGTTKNEKAREIRLKPEALEMLRLIREKSLYTESEDLVVATKTGKANTATNLEHRMATIFKNAGLVEYTGALHIFRRTFATQMYEEGARVKDIAAYIGDLASTTEQYYIAARKKVKVGDKSKHIVELPKAKG